MLYLNVGCGDKRYNGNVINIDMNRNISWYDEDGALTKKMQTDVQADMRFLPFKNEAFDGVIASHVLEHIPKEHHQFTISEIRRVIKFEGTLFIEVPDMMRVCQFFVDNYLGIRDEYWYNCIYGRGAFPGDQHLSGFIQQTLTDLLLENGFHKLDWLYQEWGDKPWVNRPYISVIAVKTELPLHRMGYAATIDLNDNRDRLQNNRLNLRKVNQ